MVIAVLAVQGAFIEHETMLERVGAECFEIRQKKDLDRHFDGMVLSGGESTVQGKLLKELDLLDPLRNRIRAGIPILGTCAGLILLAEHLLGDTAVHLGTLPVTVKRNAYGRQLGSFYTMGEFEGIGTIPMAFIRAPYVERIQHGVQILAKVEGKIVGVRYGNQIGISFHPELEGDCRVHQIFVDMVREYAER